MRRRGASIRAAVLLLTVGVVGNACGFTLYDVPLPGGTSTGDRPYRITVEFADVLDLVPRSSVKVDDVDVGEVEEIWLAGNTARVRLRLSGDVELPDNATARVRQTSLLGEKFVSLAPPATARPRGRLSDGDLVPLARTSRSVEVEEVLSALSLLLHGGGLDRIKTINTELTKALSGREESVRNLLTELDTFVGELDAHKADITRAIEEVDRMAARLAEQQDVLTRTLDDLPRALNVLADQRKNLTTLLTRMSELGTVGARVVEASKDDLVANLDALAPIVTELAAAGDDLPNALQLLFTYPFADSTANAVKGDFTNLQLTLQLDLREPLGEGGPSLPTELPVPTGRPTELPTELPTDVPTDVPTELPTAVPLPTEVPLPTGLPDLPGGAGMNAERSAYDPDLAALLTGVVR